ncbi:MAG: hypothetical protein DRR42_19595 [Gammaproteobacteria bacterium]|nr:MAG: hypothetical protein DRR42_19595 [Gammaproteobacteria bacterium]
MKKRLLIAIVSILFLGGLPGCKTFEAVKEDPNQTFDNPLSVPSDRKQLVREVQIMLKKKGYDPGPVDGVEGPSTRSALRAFQSEKGLPVTVGVTKGTYIQLASEKNTRKSKDDSTARVSDASAEKKSETIANGAPLSTDAAESSSANSSGGGFGELVSNAELLETADPFAGVITKINRGARVRILRHEGDWVYVEYKSKTGFIYADRIR